MNSIFHRTSVRDFTDKPVEQENIELIMKAAMAAPSAGNQQPWEFYVVTDKQKLGSLAACSPYAGCTKKAPMAIVLCYKEDVMFPECVEIDLSACAENILLEADSLGLGAVWLGIAPVQDRMDKVKEVIGIPDRLKAFAIIPCGYPVNIKEQQDRFDEKRIHYVR